MYPELTNLLPRERARAFRRHYFFRVAIVAVALLVVLTAAHAVFLLPAYLYSESQVHTEQHSLDNLNATLGTSEEQQVNTRLTALRTQVAYLAKLSAAPSASAVIRAALLISRPGITLTGFTVTPASGGQANAMTVSGIAASRDALRRYDLSLGQLSFVTSADLPISAYAKETDIPFTITLGGSLMPSAATP